MFQASKCMVLLDSVSPQTFKISDIKAVYKAESFPVLPHRQALPAMMAHLQDFSCNTASCAF